MHRFTALFVFPTLSLIVVAAVRTPTAQAQTFTVIHAFTGQGDGSQPQSGLTLDRGGNLDGTTQGRTNHGFAGTVFQLKRTNGNWVLNTLYDFGVNFHDARGPEARAVFGPDGTLYGFTPYGGSGNCLVDGIGGCGAVYNLRPPATICRTDACPWTETVLYSFTGGADGEYPHEVDPVFDQAGNLYGTTLHGGSGNLGVVFELTPSGGGWTESVIHDFTGGDDGWAPASGMIIDSAGNLYGTTQEGIYGQGTVFRLTYSGSGWVLTTLYTFQGPPDGSLPGPLIFDRSGNLYGATIGGGPSGGGTVFELMPSGGSWTFALLYDLGLGVGSEGNLAMDAVGNLYGATVGEGAFGLGSVFKLTPTGGAWTYTDLHDFKGLDDGANPIGGLTLDANGNVYGTTLNGGSEGAGVVWEIAP
jgi:uncharacterized repeat protein (TIGR03803 family)